MSEQLIREKLQELLSSSKDIHWGDDHSFVVIDCNFDTFMKVKCDELLSYFFTNECTIDVDSMTYDDFSRLPARGGVVSIGFNLKPIDVRAYKVIDDIYNPIITSINSNSEPLQNEKCLYLIGKELYSRANLISSFSMVRNILDCNTVLKALKEIADYQDNETFIILGGNDRIVQYSTKIRLGDICDVSIYKNFFIEASQNINSEIRQLLKSEVNNHVGHRKTKQERTSDIFSSLSMIMDDFQIVRSTYLKDFDSQNIRSKFNIRERNFEKEIKNSLQNLKSELILFLSAFFAMSEVYNTQSTTVSILIIIALAITGLICCCLLNSDRNQLKAMKKSIDEEEKKLDEIKNDINNSSATEFVQKLKVLRKSIIINSRLICVAMVTSFLPLVTAIVIMLVQLFVSKPIETIYISIDFI